MIGDASQRITMSLGRLAVHSRVPLYRNAYALMASSAVTSVLGLVYWIVAARMYPADAVGFNGAAISAMMFLAGLAQLNLISVLVRFVPEAGRQARAFILTAYGVTLAVAFVASVAFASGIDVFAPALRSLFGSPGLVLWFALATMGWGVFVLEDSAMTGLRHAMWVPVSNSVFAIVKIALLVVLAGAAPAYGIFGSWTASLAVVLVLTNILIFGRLLRRGRVMPAEAAPRLSIRSITGYMSADYVGSLFWLTCTTLLPVIVTAIAGVRANAYFYLAWQIGYSLHILSISTGSSLIVESVLSRAELVAYSRRVFVHNVRITLPAAVAVMVLAPYLMALFGPAYASEGTTLLRLLALGAVPFSVVSLAISVARVQRRMRRVVAILGAMCAIVLVLTEVLLRQLGLSGVGVAWVTAQLVLAATVLVTQLMPLWSSTVRDPDKAALLALAGRARAAVRRRGFSLGHAGLPRRVLAAMAPVPGMPAPSTWRAHRVLSVSDDIAVLTLDASRAQREVAVLKLGRTALGAASILRSVEVGNRLRADPRLTAFHAMLPEVLACGRTGAFDFVIERTIPGLDGRVALRDERQHGAVLAGAFDAIRPLHQASARTVVVGLAQTARWIDVPIDAIISLAATRKALAARLPALERLRRELRAAVIGRTATVGWIHGDFVPGNVVFDQAEGRVAGIVDWDQAADDDLPAVDLMQFILASRVAAGGRELGAVVTALLAAPAFTPAEAAALDMVWRPGDVRLAPAQLVLLCWLRHVAGNLGKSNHFDRNTWWIRHNVEAILDALPMPSPPRLHVVPEEAAASRRPERWRAIPILLYHSVDDDPEPYIAPFTVTPKMFERQMELLEGRVVLTVAELVARIACGEAVPDNAAVLTFDDGFADNLEFVAPLLDRRGLAATVYVTTGYVDGTSGRRSPGRMLSWSGVAELEAAGFEIGAHGHRHVQLDAVPLVDARADIVMSKVLLEQRLGRPVATFAYPHGYRSRAVVNAVRDAGFDGACAVRNALSHAGDDRWSLARLTVRADTPLEVVAAWVRGQGAPAARSGDAVQTVAWRGVRRLAAVSHGSSR